MWWVYFRRGDELVGAAIIEAPSLYHARTRVAVRGIGRPADFSGGKEVGTEQASLIPHDCIGRLLSPEEAQQLPQPAAVR